jgi:CubicO group peptidase (beta-lactamase class C family)
MSKYSTIKNPCASTFSDIASISKTFTGFCIMKAVEEGKVSLDEDLN